MASLDPRQLGPYERISYDLQRVNGPLKEQQVSSMSEDVILTAYALIPSENPWWTAQNPSLKERAIHVLKNRAEQSASCQKASQLFLENSLNLSALLERLEEAIRSENLPLLCYLADRSKSLPIAARLWLTGPDDSGATLLHLAAAKDYQAFNLVVQIIPPRWRRQFMKQKNQEGMTPIELIPIELLRRPLIWSHDQTVRTAIATRLVRLDPGYLASVFSSFHIESAETRFWFAEYLLHKDPGALAQHIHKMRIEDEAPRLSWARLLLSRAPVALASCIQNFQIRDEGQRFELAKALTVTSYEQVILSIANFSLTEEHQFVIAKACLNAIEGDNDHLSLVNFDFRVGSTVFKEKFGELFVTLLNKAPLTAYALAEHLHLDQVTYALSILETWDEEKAVSLLVPLFDQSKEAMGLLQELMKKDERTRQNSLKSLVKFAVGLQLAPDLDLIWDRLEGLDGPLNKILKIHHPLLQDQLIVYLTLFLLGERSINPLASEPFHRQIFMILSELMEFPPSHEEPIIQLFQGAGMSLRNQQTRNPLLALFIVFLNHPKIDRRYAGELIFHIFQDKSRLMQRMTDIRNFITILGDDAFNQTRQKGMEIDFRALLLRELKEMLVPYPNLAKIPTLMFEAFASSRMPEAMGVYLLQLLSLPEYDRLPALESFQVFIESLSVGKFQEVRYHASENLHMRFLEKHSPLLFLNWQKPVREEVDLNSHRFILTKTDEPLELSLFGNETDNCLAVEKDPQNTRGLLGVLLNGGSFVIMKSRTDEAEEKTPMSAGMKASLLFFPPKDQWVMLIEPVYPLGSDSKTKHLLEQFMAKQAKQLGVICVKQVENIPDSCLEGELESFGGVAAEYVDSIGGISEDGIYKVKGPFLEVKLDQ